MSIDQSLMATVGGGFFTGVLIGWALKKVIKLAAILVGLFLAGLAYLQYQQIALINWDKIEQVSEESFTLFNATTITNSGSLSAVTELAMSNFAIPLIGSILTGFTIGFMKG